MWLDVFVVISLPFRRSRSEVSDIRNVLAMRSHVILFFPTLFSSCARLMIFRACSMSSAGCELSAFAACVRASLAWSICWFPYALNEPWNCVGLLSSWRMVDMPACDRGCSRWLPYWSWWWRLL